MLLLLAHHLEVCASIGSPVMRRMKWPTTYTRYFALQMQSMKRELADERDAANERLVKRIRLEKAPSFKVARSSLGGG